MMKIISPFDLSSNSQLISGSGISPTTTDMRGTSAIGGVREWGSLEYDTNLKIYSGIGNKQISPFDLSKNSQLIGGSGISPTTTDMRETSAIGGVREWGSLEYDSELLIKYTNIWTINGISIENIKTINSVATENTKTVQGLP